MEGLLFLILVVFICTSEIPFPTESLLVDLIVEPSPVRLLSTARLRCSFAGAEDLKLQYIAWYKIDFDGKRTFVYDYSFVCPNGIANHTSQSYNDLKDRSLLFVTEPLSSSGVGKSSPEFQDHQSDWRERDVLRRASLEMLKKGAFVHSTGAESVSSPKQPVAGGGTAILLINDVWFLDEAKYECIIKPIGQPAQNDIAHLFIVVLPTNPIITLSSEGPYKENDTATLKCHGNVGRPAGYLTWLRRAPNALTYDTIPDEDTTTSIIHHDNGTTSAELSLQIQLETRDDKSIFKCLAKSRAMRPWEPTPNATKTITVHFSPRGGKILFDAASNRYYCYAKGSPTPEYVWLWHRGNDGDSLPQDDVDTIMSTNQYLDISSIQGTGHFLFKCLVSNVIDGKRSTLTLETELNLSGTPAPYTSPPPLNTQSQQNPDSIPITPPPTPPPEVNNFPNAHIFHHLNHINEHIRETKPFDDIIQYLETNSATPEPLDVTPKYNPYSHDIIQYLDTNIHNEGLPYPVIIEEPSKVDVIVTTPSPLSTTTTSSTSTTDIATREADSSIPLTPARAATRRSGRVRGSGGRGGFAGFEEIEQVLLIPNEPKPPIKKSSRPIQRRMKNIKNLRLRRLRALRNRRMRSNMRRRKPPIIRPLQKVIPPLEPIAPQGSKDRSYPVGSYPMILPLQHKRRFNQLFLKKDGEENVELEEPIENIQEDNVESKSMEYLDWPEEPLGQPGENTATEYEQHSSDRYPEHEIRDHKIEYDYPWEYENNNEYFNSYTDDDSDYYTNGETWEQTPQYQSVETTPSTINRNHHTAEDMSQTLDEIYKDSPAMMPFEVIDESLPKDSTGLTLEELYKKNPSFLPTQNNIPEKIHEELPPSGLTLQELYKNSPQLLPMALTPKAANEVLKDTWVNPMQGKETHTHKDLKSKSEKTNGKTLKEIYKEITDQNHKLSEDNILDQSRLLMDQYSKRGPNSATQEYQARGIPLFNLAQMQSALDSTTLDSESESIEKAAGLNCVGMPDGAYGGGCRAFYRCLGGVAYFVECKEGFAFNRNTGGCSSLTSAPAPCGKWRDCRSLPDAKYPDTERWCRFYYTCDKGQFLGHNECNPGLVFNFEKQVCDWPANVVAPPCGRQP
ncbi:hypothetical protein CAPTEDRAFT_213333 [Capitella teleta]|uniref:Chitinase n=1 Tax=Capitella teleta TaxID=283909 RepID=R7TPY8_CAPTE|nr:hypothetical protein CAPTEDRAFT_213333 [Capitella teleta]|eukprot:ELT95632.1 hypothetical protein CAPTEDRAFT_213333 [Capitella teleta]